MKTMPIPLDGRGSRNTVYKVAGGLSQWVCRKQRRWTWKSRWGVSGRGGRKGLLLGGPGEGLEIQKGGDPKCK